ncbi:hypothetical protein CY0110_16007 [Crocosphaera chwakensis CCY0110]|uniref:Uncharacterized protein n=1 Tax=Crocosphaera chwakensis CCY0110 TaxID=391612 RepID=A3IHN3_9CHRO|nr:hypothetical protein CY0110_16007 [Crocosphaera chwakensis CCY0110]
MLAVRISYPKDSSRSSNISTLSSLSSTINSFVPVS